ncbi:MAG TPA: serine/threonine-protein kinase, partial [Lysobacter sp.]|nr:serine/threonine-protein kinase [Lysobacter sp.]
MNTTIPNDPVPDNDPDRTQLLATRSSVAHDAVDGTVPAGARIGRYRIEALLGRGGMGEVYRAEQLEPVRRTVALKLLRTQRLDARSLAYFEIERQLLAQMRHPSIAQVFDAGTTDDGHPYFAMEFIDGLPLTQFCDRHGLSLRQRVALFIRICEGVQHAHEKGVVHRDLKPGNLLVDQVDGRALPKIIDFGIAVSLDGRRDAAGTPDYMSPEQAGSHSGPSLAPGSDTGHTEPVAVDTRSDVYSLGVVLYELLTGQRPLVTGETVTNNAHTQRLPSAQLATLPPEDADRIARSQGFSLPQMSRLLRCELDWVVSKAMRYDRNDRYASAAALADDLQRFLDDRPVKAAPSTRVYVWGKFVHRHRAPLLAVAFALVALLGGLVLSVYGLMQARTQRAIAEQRSNELGKVAAFQQSMLQDIDIEAMGISLADGLRDQLDNAPAADRDALALALARASTADIARSVIDRNMLAAAESAIARDFPKDPELAADLHESVARVRNALGLHEAAAEGFRRVADYRTQALGPAAHATLEARQLRINAMLLAAQAKQALPLLQQALDDTETLPADDPLRIKLQLDEGNAIATLGDRKRARTLLEALYQRSVELRGERDPATMEVMNSLSILLSRMGESKLARERMERQLVISEEVSGPDHPDTLDVLANLAVLRATTDDLPGALELQRKVVELRERRLGSEHPGTLGARGNLATMLINSGASDQALPLQIEVLEASARVLGADHPQALRAKLNLSTLYARLNQFDKTLPLQQEVVAARIRVLGPRHPDTIFIRLNHAGSLRQAGQFKASMDEVTQALPLALEILGDQHPQTQAGIEILADVAWDLDDLPLALANYQRLLDVREKGGAS